MPNRTFYVKEGKEQLIKRAAKLLAFHEDKSLSEFIEEECEQIVKRYESKGELK